MKYDGLVFDLDGTLWNTCAVVAKGWNKAIAELGIQREALVEEDFSPLMGGTHHDTMKNFLPELDVSTKQKVIELGYAQTHDLLFQEGGDLYPGVEIGLSALSKQSKLYLVSNCQVNYLEAFWKYSKLKALFADWECHGNTGKPKGENIVQLCERNELKRPVYVGDTESDQTAAQFAKIDYLHVDYGFGEPFQTCDRVATFPECVDYLMKGEA